MPHRNALNPQTGESYDDLLVITVPDKSVELAGEPADG